MKLTRRTFLRGVSLSGAIVRVGLPPLEAMFNPNGTAYAAESNRLGKPAESRFLFWFNGNGIPERYWIPMETASDEETIHKIFASFRDSGFHFKEVLLGVVRSPQFREGLGRNP